MGQVDAKVAIVTGGASGIGATCAATLARGGAKAVVTDLEDAAGRTVAEKIGGAGGEAIFLHHDVKCRGGRAGNNRNRRGALWTSGRDGGQYRDRHFVQGGRDVVGRLAATNRSKPSTGCFCRSITRCRQCAAWAAARSSSCRRWPASGDRPVWPATGGVRLFAKAVATECAAAGDGIRVNTAHPGVIDTPIWTKIAGWAGRHVPFDPNEIAKPWCRSGKPRRRKTSRTEYSSSPRTRPTTRSARSS
jgi:NAD(P)-dependent dehydrogenase (short-subunit alcohol dehydrogenase family)